MLHPAISPAVRCTPEAQQAEYKCPFCKKIFKGCDGMCIEIEYTANGVPHYGWIMFDSPECFMRNTGVLGTA